MRKKLKNLFKLMMEQSQICVSHNNAVLITSSNDTCVISGTSRASNVGNTTLQEIKK